MSDSIFDLLGPELDGKTITLNLSLIERDESWNMRTGDWKADLEKLELAMLPSGYDGKILQDAPVVVRPVKGEKPFSLVSGFGRCEVIDRYAKHHMLSDARVSCIVRVMTEGEALAMNVRENTARTDVKQADIARQVFRIYDWYASQHGVYLTSEELSRSVGVAPPIVARMLTVMRRGSDELIEFWQNSRVPISLQDLASVVTRYPRLEHLSAFRALLVKPPTNRNKNISIITGKKVSVLQRAKQMGALLGALEAKGHITVNNRDFSEYVDLLVSGLAERLTYRKLMVSSTISKAYLTAKVSGEILDVDVESEQSFD
jgi:hypothetical protein